MTLRHALMEMLEQDFDIRLDAVLQFLFSNEPAEMLPDVGVRRLAVPNTVHVSVVPVNPTGTLRHLLDQGCLSAIFFAHGMLCFQLVTGLWKR